MTFDLCPVAKLADITYLVVYGIIKSISIWSFMVNDMFEGNITTLLHVHVVDYLINHLFLFINGNLYILCNSYIF